MSLRWPHLCMTCLRSARGRACNALLKSSVPATRHSTCSSCGAEKNTNNPLNPNRDQAWQRPGHTNTHLGALGRNGLCSEDATWRFNHAPNPVISSACPAQSRHQLAYLSNTRPSSLGCIRFTKCAIQLDITLGSKRTCSEASTLGSKKAEMLSSSARWETSNRPHLQHRCMNHNAIVHLYWLQPGLGFQLQMVVARTGSRAR